MSNYNLISVDTIISKLFREGIVSSEYNESDIIEMIGEALSAIGAYKQYEPSVEFLTILNHQAMLPEGLQEIEMVAYSLNPKLDAAKCNVDCNVDDTCLGACDQEESSNCWSANNAYYIPDQRYFDVVNDFTNTHSSLTNYFYQNYLPLRLAQSPFSITKMLHCDDCANISYPSEEEYSIQNGMLRTSFQEGNVCIAFLKTPLDEDGYPLIPDMYEYQQAIVAYIMMLDSKKRYFLDPSYMHKHMYNQMTSDWHWYVKSAKNKQLMPSNVDERETLFRGNMKMLKNNKGYYNFFGNLNDLEKFNLNGRTRGPRQ